MPDTDGKSTRLDAQSMNNTTTLFLNQMNYSVNNQRLLSQTLRWPGNDNSFSSLSGALGLMGNLLTFLVLRRQDKFIVSLSIVVVRETQ